MGRIKMESSNIDLISYNEAEQILSIWFKNRKGDTHYNYKNFDFVTYGQFLTAESKGKYFSSEIRNNFDVEKIEDEGGE